jgi:hypothetical protein
MLMIHKSCLSFSGDPFSFMPISCMCGVIERSTQGRLRLIVINCHHLN